ncbi:MAG: hypothetical protein RMJ15_08910 [Nitrososphaerota archaeon]|nr:hypothetical protein [Nitrososphaerota archaeon]
MDRALSFLSDVLQVDLLRYKLTVLGCCDPTYGKEMDCMEVAYRLESKDSKFSVLFIFRKDFVRSFDIFNREGVIHYSQPQPIGYIKRAKAFLERYVRWTGDQKYVMLSEMLEKIPKAETGNITIGNMKLEFSIGDRDAGLSWRLLYGDFELDGPAIQFENGEFRMFFEPYVLCKVGSLEVKVSRAEAIGIARGLAGNFSWRVGVEPNVTVVREFRILDEPVQASLSLFEREPLTLYPHWHVTLYLDKTYPGFVTGIMVGIWADTGEVHYIKPLGASGYPVPPEETAGEEPTSKEQPLPLSQTAIITAALTITAALSLLAAKKMRRKTAPIFWFGLCNLLRDY